MPNADVADRGLMFPNDLPPSASGTTAHGSFAMPVRRRRKIHSQSQPRPGKQELANRFGWLCCEPDSMGREGATEVSWFARSRDPQRLRLTREAGFRVMRRE